MYHWCLLATGVLIILLSLRTGTVIMKMRTNISDIASNI